MKIALIYTIFAVIATAANILSQDITLRLYSGLYTITLSILVGTAVGLVVKYVLDKKYIFQYQTQNLQHDSRTFMLYSLMGVLTTVIFWGFEFGFDALFATKEMRYLGGVIGLAIGYFIKYQLDKRFVFVHKEATP
ncbi:GtrA family protein [Thiomicrorhabdus sp. zzn3]|uniref:GtrA family protein n=1 Tax=Thiomicrorhabdus sp. zzn3 TaxID=3039775 RepID=UPI0024369020|nr:GtrA family protein [Thiomicrorhabdus sp. zzn3]MDG6778562.1 GtrA family protein [Thiomicrorhabdus sp. zzn3]